MLMSPPQIWETEVSYESKMGLETKQTRSQDLCKYLRSRVLKQQFTNVATMYAAQRSLLLQINLSQMFMEVLAKHLLSVQ